MALFSEAVGLKSIDLCYILFISLPATMFSEASSETYNYIHAQVVVERNAFFMNCLSCSINSVPTKYLQT